MGKRFFLLPLFASLASSTVMPAQSPSLVIQADHSTAKVNPMFYGLMTEEINFSYDGGLYAELIRDRTVGPGRRPLFYWTHVAKGASMVDVTVDDHTGPSTALARSIKMTVSEASESAPAGIQNGGYWGIAVRPNTTYRGSFYAKADVEGLPITANLVNDETGATAASATVSGVTTD
jgi:alpha-N-arabinofuranosidase